MTPSRGFEFTAEDEEGRDLIFDVRISRACLDGSLDDEAESRLILRGLIQSLSPADQRIMSHMVPFGATIGIDGELILSVGVGTQVESLDEQGTTCCI